MNLTFAYTLTFNKICGKSTYNTNATKSLIKRMLTLANNEANNEVEIFYFTTSLVLLAF